MTALKITIDQARKLALHAQLSRTGPPGQVSEPSLLGWIRQLGYVQLDSIPVVARAHHLTLHSRLKEYRNGDIYKCLAKERSVFEYWAHAAAFIPMEDYRFYLRKMESFYHEKGNWMKMHLDKAGHLLGEVKNRIRDEGPLASSDFKAPKGHKGGGWWAWKPAKFALELLFWRGELMVHRRKNFQRVYDLRERILPSDLDLRQPSIDDLAQFQVLKSLSSLGLLREKEIFQFLKLTTRKELSQSLQNLKSEGQVQELNIEGLHGPPFYILPEIYERLDSLPAYKDLHILCPFDNLIIQRSRIRDLFDFEYTIECYVPKEKRKYGYYSMPVLYGDQFVARMDVATERKNSTLVIRNLHFEDGFKIESNFLDHFSNKLVSFTLFNDCNNFRLEKVNVTGVKKHLQTVLKKQLIFP